MEFGGRLMSGVAARGRAFGLAVTLNEVKGLLSDGSRFFATLRMTISWQGLSILPFTGPPRV